MIDDRRLAPAGSARTVGTLALDLPCHSRGDFPVSGHQLRRAATSIGLNIAEGSIGRSRREQARYLSYSIGSLAETVAAMRLIERREYSVEPPAMDAALEVAEKLFAHLTAFRKSLLTQRPRRPGRS